MNQKADSKSIHSDLQWVEDPQKTHFHPLPLPCPQKRTLNLLRTIALDFVLRFPFVICPGLEFLLSTYSGSMFLLSCISGLQLLLCYPGLEFLLSTYSGLRLPPPSYRSFLKEGMHHRLTG